MHEQILQLEAPKSRTLHLWFEPWAEGFAFPAGTAIELRATSPVEGKLEIEASPERTAVYGWSESTLRVLVNGAEVLSFQQPVPEGLNKEMVALLFGAPPIPTAAEGGASTRRPRWRFWR